MQWDFLFKKFFEETVEEWRSPPTSDVLSIDHVNQTEYFIFILCLPNMAKTSTLNVTVAKNSRDAYPRPKRP